MIELEEREIYFRWKPCITLINFYEAIGDAIDIHWIFIGYRPALGVSFRVFSGICRLRSYPERGFGYSISDRKTSAFYSLSSLWLMQLSFSPAATSANRRSKLAKWKFPNKNRALNSKKAASAIRIKLILLIFRLNSI